MKPRLIPLRVNLRSDFFGRPVSWMLVRWHLPDGAMLGELDVVATVECEAATMELEAVHPGLLRHHLAEGDFFQLNEALGWIACREEEFEVFTQTEQARSVSVRLDPEEVVTVEDLRGEESRDEFVRRMFRDGVRMAKGRMGGEEIARRRFPDAHSVKELREATGLGWMEAKRLLEGNELALFAKIRVAHAMGMERGELRDPIEFHPDHAEMIRELKAGIERGIIEEFAADDETGGTSISGWPMGGCHLLWNRMKKELAARGIEWHSPAEMNPGCLYD